MSKESILFMWEFIIYIFLPPSLLSFSQWRMWLHFLCLYLSVYKPEYWTVPLYKASSSHSFSLSPACNKIYPRQYIQQLKTEGREAAKENSSAVSQLQEKQNAAPPTEQACLTYSHTASHEEQFLVITDSLEILFFALSSSYLPVSEYSDFLLIKNSSLLFSWMLCEIYFHFFSRIAKVKAILLLCLSLACFPQTWKNLCWIVVKCCIRQQCSLSLSLSC